MAQTRPSGRKAPARPSDRIRLYRFRSASFSKVASSDEGASSVLRIQHQLRTTLKPASCRPGIPASPLKWASPGTGNVVSPFFLKMFFARLVSSLLSECTYYAALLDFSLVTLGFVLRDTHLLTKAPVRPPTVPMACCSIRHNRSCGDEWAQARYRQCPDTPAVRSCTSRDHLPYWRRPGYFSGILGFFFMSEIASASLIWQITRRYHFQEAGTLLATASA